MARQEEHAPHLPPLLALVVILFDHRRGNSVLWQRTVDELKLSDGIEFRALPSGLHKTESDVLYFIQDDHAGISVFENVTDTTARRGASFHSVAALTPRSGRLGKLWLHASGLRTLSRHIKLLVGDASNAQSQNEPELDVEATRKLEEYWSTFRTPQSTRQEAAATADSQQDGPQSPSLDRRRRRGLSDATPMAQAPDSHPARSVSLFLDTFGPLVFPLYREALLRRRILIIQKPPLQHVCHFVYILSIISNLPAALTNSIKAHELETLFSVVLHDIASLTKQTHQPEQYGWIACSSEELLATKSDLFDVEVEFNHQPNSQTPQRWPMIKRSDDTLVKATQRDLYHYKALRTHIGKLYEAKTPTERYRDDVESAIDESSNEDSSLLVHDQEDAVDSDPSTYPIEDEASIAEPPSWAAIAYDSFIWWASAGERDTDYRAEREYDQDILEAAFPASLKAPGDNRRRLSMSMDDQRGVDESFEASVVAYFHRMTTVMLQALIEAAPPRTSSNGAAEEESSSLDDEDEDNGFITKDDLIKMGLDVWSKGDRNFVQDLAKTYLNNDVEVQGKSVECCGVRLL